MSAPDRLTALLPQTACAEAYADGPAGPLPAAEAAAMVGASAARRREFATTRACARRALVTLGAPVRALPPDTDRVPQWPTGVVGSLTHCAGYRGAAVAWSHQVRTLGIDAEPYEALPPEVADLVLHPDERDALAGLHADTIAFSAKEAVYKAWYPLTRTWLDFTDVTVDLHHDGTFAARIQGVDTLQGRWSVSDGLIVTGVAA